MGYPEYNECSDQTKITSALEDVFSLNILINTSFHPVPDDIVPHHYILWFGDNTCFVWKRQEATGNTLGLQTVECSQRLGDCTLLVLLAVDNERRRRILPAVKESRSGHVVLVYRLWLRVRVRHVEFVEIVKDGLFRRKGDRRVDCSALPDCTAKLSL